MQVWHLAFGRSNAPAAQAFADYVYDRFDWSCSISSGRIQRIYDNNIDESVYERDDHDDDSAGLRWFLDEMPTRAIQIINERFSGNKKSLVIGAKTKLPFPKDAYKPARRTS
jgi:hypothetical protein